MKSLALVNHWLHVCLVFGAGHYTLDIHLVQERGHGQRLLRPEAGLLPPQHHGVVPHRGHHLGRRQHLQPIKAEHCTSPPITAHLVRPVVLGLGVDEAGGVLVEGGHQLAQAAALQTSANVRNKCKHKTGFRSILITPSLCRCLDFIPFRIEWRCFKAKIRNAPVLLIGPAR